MRNSFTLVVCLLSLLPAVISIPVPDWSAVVENPPAVDDADSQARVKAFDEANGRAKEMVENMHKVVNSNDPKHKALVEAAFGPNADHAQIKATVEKLHTQQVKVGTTDVANVKNAKLVATTPMPNRPNPPAGPIKLGPEFFAADGSKDFRAGTLIHEATHQQSYTGDVVNNDDKMIGALAKQKENVKPQADGRPTVGYQFQEPPNHKNPPKTAADLSDKYKNFIATTKDTHNNADSYRVLAHFCSEPGVVRRDVLLFGRALMEADHEERHSLARRQSCKLPPDYFKKKAEAKAAAAKKAESPASLKSKAEHEGSTRTGLKSKSASKGVKSLKGLAKLASNHGASKGVGHTSKRRTRKTGSKARSERQQKASKPESRKTSWAASLKTVAQALPKKSGRK